MNRVIPHGARGRALFALAGAVIVSAAIGIAVLSTGGSDGDATDTNGPDVASTVAGVGTQRQRDTGATGGPVSAGAEAVDTTVAGPGAGEGTAVSPTTSLPAASTTRAGDGTGTTGPAAPTSSVPLSTLAAPAGGVAITSPLSNAVVGRTLSVQGSAGSLPADHELWLVVRPVQEQRYVVQGDGPLSVVDGIWQGSVTVGDGTSATAGQRFLIYVVDVDKSGGDVLRSERVDAATGGVELPPGAAKAAAVMVELQP